jgi:UDP-N-acetylglucosamine kinase
MNIDISQSESDEIFSDILFDFVEIKRPSTSTNPKGIILGGQPGSGKSYLKDEVILEFKESFIFISTDDLRLYHPVYLELQQNPETVQDAANLVNPYASAWTEKLIKYCIENKYNLIIDSTLSGNIQAVYDTINMFRNNGYQVYLRVMAVPAIISKLSIFLRYETQLAEKGFARWTRMEDHKDRFENLEDNLSQILMHGTPNSIAFYRREYGKNGTDKLSQFEYVNCKNVTNKLDLLKYKYWYLFESYREFPISEEISFLVSASNKVVELIKKRNGNLENFKNYIRDDLRFFNLSSFHKEKSSLDSFILKILDDYETNDASINDDDIEIIIK